jgi:hypothetical protein
MTKDLLQSRLRYAHFGWLCTSGLQLDYLGNTGVASNFRDELRRRMDGFDGSVQFDELARRKSHVGCTGVV